MFPIFLNSFVLFFITIDTIGNLPFFISLTEGAKIKKKNQIAIKSIIYAFFILILMLLTQRSSARSSPSLPNTAQETNEEGSATCDQCGLVYTTLRALGQHKRWCTKTLASGIFLLILGWTSKQGLTRKIRKNCKVM